MLSCFDYTIQIALFTIHAVNSLSILNSHGYALENSGSEAEVTSLLSSKSYVPKDRDLPKTLVKNIENDGTYILSKLSDEQLIKLLSEQPTKNEYYLSDLIKLAVGNTAKDDNKMIPDLGKSKVHDNMLNNGFEMQSNFKNRFRTIEKPTIGKAQSAYFRLENKEVDPYHVKNEADYAAFQKINNLLYSRPQVDELSEEDEEKKELLFDVLVAQLKSLCCKKSKKKRKNKKQYLSQFLPRAPISKMYAEDLKPPQLLNEYMFLIMNEEVRGNGSEELISVDPESLEKNSSVLLLGPITTPLTDNQLKTVMTRISNELSKQEYVPLLQQLAEGSVSSGHLNLLKNVMHSPLTRRYIKPHRCNHQSKLAKVYGGPKWIICTGYLNINTPSLYD
ncbi:hypothetical protein RR46_08992 [Papilio xuthus]|uniref:Uncharacterized protein n=1 Tax=Papilio xuthus TaxID=66420 RepID=A0A194PRF1_PAPXU|nr:hypothetical protein RR46_08992 [Papilio xuthus]